MQGRTKEHAQREGIEGYVIGKRIIKYLVLRVLHANRRTEEEKERIVAG